VYPSKIRLNAFQKSELKVFASCIEFGVQFIQRPVGVNFETNEATCVRLETMLNSYKAKHKATIKREAEEKKISKQNAKQEANQRAKEKVEEERRAKEMKQKFTECLTKRHRSTAEYFTW
jgi:hypothetical protein